MNQEARNGRLAEKQNEARIIVAVICLVSGILHILGGHLLVMLFGIGYVFAAVALFRRWGVAKRVTATLATLRGLGTLLLLLLKLPGLLGGNAAPEIVLMVLRDSFWLCVNIIILLLIRDRSPSVRHEGKGGCV